MININKEKCTNCNLCVNVCVQKAVIIDEYKIDDKRCFQCSHCVSICPEQAISFNDKIPEKIVEESVRENNYKNLIYTRRSIRHFLNKDVEPEKINKIVDLVRYSPTGTNCQNVYLTIVDTSKKVQTLTAKIMKLFIYVYRLNLIIFPILVLLLSYKNAKKIFRLKKYFTRYKDGEDVLSNNAPALFIFHTSKKISSTPAEDCNIASTIALFHARTLGLGTCLNGYIVRAINFSKRIKKDLAIPKSHRIYSVFLMGYPKYKFSNKVFRNELKVNIIK